MKQNTKNEVVPILVRTQELLKPESWCFFLFSLEEIFMFCRPKDTFVHFGFLMSHFGLCVCERESFAFQWIYGLYRMLL